MFWRHLVFAVLALLALSASVDGRMSQHHQLVPRRPSDPSSDPFYTPDGGWEDEAAGAILKTRKVDIAELSVLKLGVTGYQLLYRTNGVTGDSPTYSVTTVLVPDNYDHDKLVAANVYEDAYSSECAPSYTLRAGAPIFKNVVISYQELFFTTLLHEGWVVTVPDHQGPKNAFTSGRLEGHAVLDAIRATLSFDKVGLDKDAKVAGYGYSGGALATGWAAGLQNQYAPNLNVVGWSMGGTVSNVTEWFQYIDGTRGAGFAVAGVFGLMSSYKSLSWIKDALTSQGRKTLARSKKSCLYENLWQNTGKKFISDTYFKGGSDFFNNQSTLKTLDSLTMGKYSRFVPKAPVYMFHAKNDEVVPYDMAYDTAHAWCDQGARIRFETETGPFLAHQNTELYSMPNVVFFLRDRFSNKSWGARCQYPSVVNPELSPNVLGKSISSVLQQVLDLLGNRIGKHDSIVKHKVDQEKNP
ncbi:hypothetical protein MSPP1_001611 [Malassezia sp. CBS 17886]|nr:hypothetical protein MSPP1_001611 [Malassezia sp. CBS 17886]